MKLTAIRDHLLQNDYILEVSTQTNKFTFSDSFYRDLEKETRKELSEKLTAQTRLLTDTELYKRFLVDAKVPRTGTTEMGSVYILGAFTKTGSKALKDILNKGIDYLTLCAAVSMYYAKTTYCIKVEAFLKEGLWETFYDLVKDGEPIKETFKEKLSIGHINKTLG